jgi:hypothetical protein
MHKNIDFNFKALELNLFCVKNITYEVLSAHGHNAFETTLYLYLY